MAIKVGSTTIPTTLGSIKVGSTNVTKVNVVSGGTTTTVWEAIVDPIYAVNMGEASGLITNPTFIHTNGSGVETGSNIQPDGMDILVWGIYGYNGDGTTWSVDTGSMSTNGASTLEFSVKYVSYGDSGNNNKYLDITVYSGSTEIYTKQIDETVGDEWSTPSGWEGELTPITVDISGYSSVSIKIEMSGDIGGTTIIFGLAYATIR